MKAIDYLRKIWNGRQERAEAEHKARSVQKYGVRYGQYTKTSHHLAIQVTTNDGFTWETLTGAWYIGGSSIKPERNHPVLLDTPEEAQKFIVANISTLEAWKAFTEAQDMIYERYVAKYNRYMESLRTDTTRVI
jgi:hypothetical protein